MPETILFAHNNNDLYGAEVILLQLLKRLDPARFYPIVVLPTDTKHIGRLSWRLDQEGIEYHFIRMGIIRRKYFHPVGVVRYAVELLLGVFSLAVLMHRRRVALVHTNTLAVLSGAIAAWLMRRPHVWHIHEIIVSPKVAKKVFHFLAVRFSRVVVTVSGAVRAHILADFPESSDKVKVIYNGIDLSPYLLDSGGAKIRKEFGVPQGELLVGMVGKVCRWKGQIQFQQAAVLVLESRPDTRFLAVGGVFDDEMNDMERFREAVEGAHLETKFMISDFRTDIPSVLSAMDIFVLPSTQPDPFPTVVLEAMAAGKPVIATAHGGPVEMVVEGETGFLVAPGDPRALADAILRLAEVPSLRVAMGTAGRRRVTEHFNLDRFVSEFQALYDRTLAPVFVRPSPVKKHESSESVDL
jgi:glycosyltransferase involved in cell wall biosynthesis